LKFLSATEEKSSSDEHGIFLQSHEELAGVGLLRKDDVAQTFKYKHRCQLEQNFN
jgi:hypothetical protein